MPSRKSLAIKLSPLAEEDLEDIAHYTLLHHGPRQLDEYTHAIDEALQHIAVFPQIGHTRSDLPRYRLFSVRHHCIIYQHMAEAVMIVRILHQKMNLHHKTLQ